MKNTDWYDLKKAKGDMKKQKRIKKAVREKRKNE